MIDALLCEFEGVLADTDTLRRRALQQALADEGLSLPGDVAREQCAGLALESSVRAALHAVGEARDETGVALLALRASRHFTALTAKGLSLVPGARDLVERARSITRVALVTRAGRREVEYVLALAELEGAFECVVTGDEVSAPPPAPDVVRAALERLGRRRPVRRERCVALVDALPALRAAHAAGIHAAAIAPVSPAVAAEADAVIPALHEAPIAALDSMLEGSPESIA